MRVPCEKGGWHCNWPACPLDCPGRRLHGVIYGDGFVMYIEKKTSPWAYHDQARDRCAR